MRGHAYAAERERRATATHASREVRASWRYSWHAKVAARCLAARATARHGKEQRSGLVGGMVDSTRKQNHHDDATLDRSRSLYQSGREPAAALSSDP